MINEDPSLKLLQPVPQEKLDGWLKEFYGRAVQIQKRELLRHRDLSYVERLWIANSLPASLIYKLVLPPWDIEQDINERVLIPSVSNSAQLYLTTHYKELGVLFLEDLGPDSLLKIGTAELAKKLGESLAKLHRSYIYRVDELIQTKILQIITPLDYPDLATKITEQLNNWRLSSKKDIARLEEIAKMLSINLAAEPISLVHGDCFAENIIFHNNRLYIIDWSWFSFIGVPLLDLATITMPHAKNGHFIRFKDDIIESYCHEAAREITDVIKLLPSARILSRLLFLYWLVERKSKGIEGTTAGPVNNLIPQVVQEIFTMEK